MMDAGEVWGLQEEGNFKGVLLTAETFTANYLFLLLFLFLQVFHTSQLIKYTQ